MFLINWNDCPIVTRRPDYLSGAPALRADPRITPETIVDHMDYGETAEQVIENFGLRTSVTDVMAVYAYAKARLERHP
jgi:uncharacterized protein (DUF433 family)